MPGAHYLHLDRDLSGPKTGTNGRHPLPDRARLVETLESRGLKQGQQVVAYDAQGGMYAARAWWLLRWLGHDAVALLDGGLQAWQAAGQPLTQDAPAQNTGDFKAGAPLAVTVDAQAVERNLGIARTRGGRCPRGRSLSRRERDAGSGRRPHSGRAQPFLQGQPRPPTAASRPAHTLREAFRALLGERRRIMSCCNAARA